MSIFYRKTINISPRNHILLMVIFLPATFFALYSLGKQIMVLHDREINYFIKKETNGRIVGINDQGKTLPSFKGRG
jgi:hypothetical protein